MKCGVKLRIGVDRNSLAGSREGKDNGYGVKNSPTAFLCKRYSHSPIYQHVILIIAYYPCKETRNVAACGSDPATRSIYPLLGMSARSNKPARTKQASSESVFSYQCLSPLVVSCECNQVGILYLHCEKHLTQKAYSGFSPHHYTHTYLFLGRFFFIHKFSPFSLSSFVLRHRTLQSSYSELL